MRHSILCVSAALLLLLALLPGRAVAQTGLEVVEEDVVLTRTSYPPVRPSEGPVEVYAGNWRLKFGVHNYDLEDWYHSWVGYVAHATVKIFLDNVLVAEELPTYRYSDYGWPSTGYGVRVGTDSEVSVLNFDLSEPGEHEVLIQAWHGDSDETTPQDTYRFTVTAVEPEVSGLQASSRVVRALGDNSLGVSFTNGGNADMRQATLSVADSSGLEISPEEVEFGDVDAGESATAEFTVSSPADVTLGTAQVRFSLSFVDYAGISHEEDVSADVEVYRLESTLTVSAPSEVENGGTVEIAATLRDPDGQPIAGESVTLTVAGVELGAFETGSDGTARASYTATETGTLDIGGSFAGSASYGAASDSGELDVTSQAVGASFPWWILALIALLAALSAAGLATYLWWRRKKRGAPTGKRRR